MKTTKKPISVTVETEMLEKIEKRMELLGLSRSQVLRLAINNYLQNDTNEPLEVALLVQLRDTVNSMPVNTSQRERIMEQLDEEVTNLISLKGCERR